MQTLTEYRTFISAVDKECARLFKKHKPHLRCRKGCGECCEDIRVLPIEIENIRMWLGGQQEVWERVRLRNRHPKNTCLFLDTFSSSCLIYPARPFICRVHGVPLRYVVEEYNQDGKRINMDSPSRQLIWCEKNFTDIDKLNGPSFFPNYMTIDMGDYLSELKKINRDFFAGRPYNGNVDDHLPLSIFSPLH